LTVNLINFAPHKTSSRMLYMYVTDSDSKYRDADKSLARPTSRCIFFDGENNSFDASLVIIYIYIYIYY